MRRVAMAAVLLAALAAGPAASYSQEAQSPRQQVESGVAPADVVCREGLELVIRAGGGAACVRPATAELMRSAGIAAGTAGSGDRMETGGRMEMDGEEAAPGEVGGAMMSDEDGGAMMSDEDGGAMMSDEDGGAMMSDEDGGAMEADGDHMGTVTGVPGGEADNATSEGGADAAGSAGGAELSGEVLVASLLPKSGDLSEHGKENGFAAELAVSDFNEYLSGKGAGWTVRLVDEDSETKPAVALEKAQNLKARGINFILGPETSSNTKHIKPYIEQNGMLAFSCCSSSPALAIEGDRVFRMVPDDTKQGKAIATLLRHQGVEAIAPVYRGDTWGDGLSEALKTEFEAMGGTVSAEDLRYTPEQPEFSVLVDLLNTEVAALSEEHGAENVAVPLISFEEAVSIMQSAEAHPALGEVGWYGPGAISKKQSLTDDPKAREFATATSFTTVNVGFSPDNDKYRSLTESIEAEWGKTATTFMYTTYDSVWITLLAIERAGLDVDAVAAAIPAVAASYEGAIGSTELNAAGDLLNADYEVWGVRGGEWERQGTYFHATGEVDLGA